MDKSRAVRKKFVVDTSVMLHDPRAIEMFGEHDVVVPIWCIEELDKIKAAGNGKSFSARGASRLLDDYRRRGSLYHSKASVMTPGGGVLSVDYRGNSTKKLPVKLEPTVDNKIIALAFELAKIQRTARDGDRRLVSIVSKDINLRLKADACGIRAEDYMRDKQLCNLSELYSGVRVIDLRDNTKDVITSLCRFGKICASDISCSVDFGMESMFPNMCCVIKIPSGKVAYAIYKKNEGIFRKVKMRTECGSCKIMPGNREQSFAYALLKDPGIKLVSLVGRAGTGKTLMALLAGYEELDDKFDQLAVYRPNVELGNSLGYLPGEISEKYAPWKYPIIDNMKLILRDGHESKRDGGTGSMYAIEELMSREMLTISPINFVRGRSLGNRFLIIDEAQNLSPHEAKTLISRAGSGTKVVLTGDPEQIDSRYLDSLGNGLCHVVERFKGQESFGHITLTKTERSPLAELAARLL